MNLNALLNQAKLTVQTVFFALPLSYRYWVLGPLVVVGIYYGLWASDRYVAEAQLVVEQDSATAPAGLDLGLLSLSGGADQNDSLIVEAFMTSPSMLAQIDALLGLREHYSSRSIDFWARLDADASLESFYSYLQDFITATVDQESNIITLRVVAFTPEMAKEISDRMTSVAEEFVNAIGQGLGAQQLAFVQGQVDQNNNRLREASNALVELQRQYEIVSPEVENATLGQIIAGLQAELAKAKTELKTKLSFLTESAPEVLASKRQVAALEKQIEQERAAQTGGEENSVSTLYLKYQEAQLAVKVATELYQASLASLESTRLEASRKVKYLVAISAAQLPDNALEPRRAYIVATWFLLLNLGYLLAMLIVATINDHRE